MSAFKEIDHDIKTLGILAGGGEMPRLLVEACQAQGVIPFVVAFEGQDDFAWLSDDIAHVFIKIGKAGRIIKALHSRNVHDLVLIGSIRKPSLAALMPDMKAMTFLVTHGYRSLGDDGLLSALRGFMEQEGFSLHGVQRFVPEIITPEGVLGDCIVPEAYLNDVAVGVSEALEWGRADKGQSVVVQEGEVIAHEGRAGTDALIQTAAHDRGARKPVLVKMCKPQQDRDLDLPTIGLHTVRYAVENGFAGIVLHAEASFFLDREKALALADKNDLFIVGITP